MISRPGEAGSRIPKIFLFIELLPITVFGKHWRKLNSGTSSFTQACLTFCEDETLVSFVKAGFKVRACFQSFREGWNALNERDWDNHPQEYKSDFESGVRLGIGSFNLLISLLPARIMRLLEFIGFQGNRVS